MDCQQAVKSFSWPVDRVVSEGRSTFVPPTSLPNDSGAFWGLSPYGFSACGLCRRRHDRSIDRISRGPIACGHG
ncbi:MAG: hypothetical protein ACRC62_20950 [Microcoleus sp.]